MWEAIQHIGSPLALAAFVVAVIATIYLARVNADLKSHEVLPDAERGQILESKLKTYHIADDNLTREQKYNLMALVLTQRAHRLQVVTRTSIAIIGIIALAIIVVFFMDRN